MFCCDQKRVDHSEQTAASQRETARQRGQLFSDDVVVFQLILQSATILYFHCQPKYFCAQRLS